jgi:beta-galactosidase
MPHARSPAAPRERIPFNDGWRFRRGDAPDARGSLAYSVLRPYLLATGTDLINEGVSRPTRPAGHPGHDVSFVRPDFDDSKWRIVTLPHDYGIEGHFSHDLPGDTGRLPWHGPAWYRKRFRVPRDDAGRRVALDVDGAMSFSTVWLNGCLVGGWPYGYTSFRLDLTPYLRQGDENVLAVRLDGPPNSSRWYPGGGLYRNLWLLKTPPVRVQRFGVFVTTPRVSAGAALVSVDTTLENTSDEKCELVLRAAVHALDADGKPSATPVALAEPCDFELGPGAQTCRTQFATLARPKLWSLGARHRYLVVTTLEQAGKVLDRVVTPFGVRTIQVDPDHGFFLNGSRVPLRGVCLHHDQGALGAAVHTRALERQIEILQSMGCNAIRTSHNPPAPELLDLCDRMGMLVMDEAFDCWRRGKRWPAGVPEHSPGIEYFDYARVFDDWHERDLRAMLRRDRNHPSVVMWSIGNEVIEQWFPDGWKLAAHLAGIVREEDRTRPITSAFNGENAAYTGFQTALDVLGYNYKPRAYALLHQRHPLACILGSETASTISSRGEYFFPVTADKLHGQVDFQVSSYDLSATQWANLAEEEFRGLDECPYVAGEFVWTGFDYLGEPTPYNADSSTLLNFSDPAARRRAAKELERLGKLRVPSRSSYFGIIDLAGLPKDRFYLYQARWRPELRMAHILPHWNWPERVGQVTPVHVYSSADEAELFLNGQSLGRRQRGPLAYRFRWDEVVYAPGELKVVTTRRGKPWATATRRTTGPAAAVALAPDRSLLCADGRDLAFVTVRIADAAGFTVPRASHLVRFSVTGPAEIVAVDNGDPTSFEPFQARRHRAFNGLALVVIRTLPGQPGAITLRATSKGLRAAQVDLDARR